MAEHLPELAPCPFLPEVDRPMRAVDMRSLGADRGSDFYERALQCAQSLWLQGLPAQSLLLMNRAFSADLEGDEEVLTRWALPYRAMVWVMSHRSEDFFIGNPRRHFQHLATRMVEPRKAIRSWRAWACWRYACLIFPDYPADEKQLEEEGVTEPKDAAIAAGLDQYGIPGEANLWREGLTLPSPEC